MKALVKSIVRIALCWLPVPQHPTHNHPGLHVHWRIGWLRGLVFRLKARVRRMFGGPLIIIGRRFSIQGALWARGCGIIRIGDDVIIDSRTDLFTYGPKATISIGQGCYLNGTRMGCMESVSVGEFSILSDVRMMDTDFHSLSKRRNERGSPIITDPISIGNNVWIAAGSAVLKGVSIGENSVVGFGSVVTKSLPANCIAAGNPCKVLGEVPE